MAGVAGLEPTHPRVKVWCLTDLAIPPCYKKAVRVFARLCWQNGVDEETRTLDNQSHNLVLYQLNYVHHNGAPTGIRTPGTRLRRPLLYPAELLAHPN